MKRLFLWGMLFLILCTSKLSALPVVFDSVLDEWVGDEVNNQPRGVVFPEEHDQVKHKLRGNLILYGTHPSVPTLQLNDGQKELPTQRAQAGLSVEPNHPLAPSPA